MLEVEVFSHESVQSHHVHEMVQVVPLRPVLLVQLFLLYQSHRILAVSSH
jgi:hypothetical protein